MANYYCTWRTNYFRVKDKELFMKWLNSLSGAVRVDEDKEGRVAMFQDGDECGVPMGRCVDDVWQDVDIYAELASHLCDKSVAVFMEIGQEKMRYLVGAAVAVDSSGKCVSVSLNDIYREAAEELESGAEVTVCEY